MATTVRASNSATSASATTISVGAPSGTTSGDLSVVVVSCNNVVTLSDNNGSTAWTKDSTTQDTSSGQTVSIFTRRIVGGDPSSYSFNQSGAAGRITAVSVTFQNPHPTTIYDVVPNGFANNGQGGADNTITALSITTLTPNAINCAIFCSDNSNNTISSLPGGYTVEKNVGDERIAFTDKVIVTPAATGNLTAAQSIADGWVSFQFAILDNPGFGSYRPVRIANPRVGPRALRHSYRYRRMPLGESSTGPNAWTLTPSDTITLSDALIKSMGLVEADTITLSEAVAKSVVLVESDTITLSESVTKTALLGKSDTLTLSDAATKAVLLSKADTITLSDVLSKLLGLTEADSITLSDDLSKVSGVGYFVNLSDTITLAEAIVKAVGLGKSDTITMSDALANVFGLSKTDTINLSEAVVKSPGLTESDTVSLSDSISKAPGLGKDDTVTLSDAIVKSLGLSKADTVALNDAISKAIVHVLADVLTLSDNAVPNLNGGATNWTLNLSDTITLADTFHRILTDEGIPSATAARARVIFLSRFGLY